MVRVATVEIRNKRNGKRRTINEHEWAGDLGTAKYSGWERMGHEKHGDEDAAVVTITETSEVESAKQREARDDKEANVAPSDEPAPTEPTEPPPAESDKLHTKGSFSGRRGGSRRK
jgi:hypothetical protein